MRVFCRDFGLRETLFCCEFCVSRGIFQIELKKIGGYTTVGIVGITICFVARPTETNQNNQLECCSVGQPMLWKHFHSFCTSAATSPLPNATSTTMEIELDFKLHSGKTRDFTSF